MRININAGHSLTGGDVGARGIGGLQEEKLTRQLAKELAYYAKKNGHTASIMAVDHVASLNESLRLQTQQLNSVSADFNVILHYNASSSHKGHGSEIFTYNGKQLPQAKKILENLNKLGFSNRGIKNQQLYVINNTNSECLYIEICFIDNEKDVNTLRTQGIKNIAKAILDGIEGKDYQIANIPPTPTTPVETYRNVIVYQESIDNADLIAANILKWGLEDSKIIEETEYKKNKIKGTSVYAIGVAGSTVKANVILQGANRYETVKEVLKRLKRL